MSSPLVAAVDLCLSTYLTKEEQNFADFECKGDIPLLYRKNLTPKNDIFGIYFTFYWSLGLHNNKHYILEIQKNILCFLTWAMCVSLSFFRAPAVFIYKSNNICLGFDMTETNMRSDQT